jgi:hypothetical protein
MPGSAQRFPGEHAGPAAGFGVGRELDVAAGCAVLALFADEAAGDDDRYAGASDDELPGAVAAWDRVDSGGRIAWSLGARVGMPCDVVPLVPLHAAGVDRGGSGQREKGMRLGPDDCPARWASGWTPGTWPRWRCRPAACWMTPA